MRNCIVLGIVLLLVACASTVPREGAGLGILDTAPVVRYYSRQSPDLYLDWKYYPGRQGADQIAEVVPNSEAGRAAVPTRPH